MSYIFVSFGQEKANSHLSHRQNNLSRMSEHCFFLHPALYGAVLTHEGLRDVLVNKLTLQRAFRSLSLLLTWNSAVTSLKKDLHKKTVRGTLVCFLGAWYVLPRFLDIQSFLVFFMCLFYFLLDWKHLSTNKQTNKCVTNIGTGCWHIHLTTE